MAVTAWYNWRSNSNERQATIVIQRVVLTGGPGAGKTAILDALAEDGIRIGVNVAREIIRDSPPD